MLRILSDCRHNKKILVQFGRRSNPKAEQKQDGRQKLLILEEHKDSPTIDD